MNNSIEFDCIIYDDYKDLLKKKVYEPIILKLMNESEIIFNGNYKYIGYSEKIHRYGSSAYSSRNCGYIKERILYGG